ncbi:MAG: hypothetical protein ACP5XB_16940 [Isosphaeraceae bacterium]
MVSYKDYIAGWLDSSIREFFDSFPRESKKMQYALITCLDSRSDPASLLHESPELEPLIANAELLEGGLLVPTKKLLEDGSHNRIFYGFDEIWFFESRITEPRPSAAWLVGPRRIDQTTINKLGPWMSANRCSMALGDGEGLNLIIKARGLVSHLIGQSLGQPAPAARDRFEPGPEGDGAALLQTVQTS